MPFTTLQWAEYYARLGFSVIPICYKSKIPSIPWEQFQERRATLEELRAWFGNGKANNIGVVTGMVSGVVVIDVDNQVGYQALVSYLNTDFFTPTCKTPRGGEHFWYRHPGDGRYPNNVRRIPGCDFRGDGGYVLVPPSVGPDGTKYTWSTHPKDADFGTLPESYIRHVLGGAEAHSSASGVEKKDSIHSNVGIGKISGGVGREYRDGTGSISNNIEYSNAHAKENGSVTGRDIIGRAVTSPCLNFGHGARDDSLFRIANMLTKGGIPSANVLEVLERIAISWGEDAGKDVKIRKWLEAKVESAAKRADRKEESLAEMIRGWARDMRGSWNVTDCDRDLGIVTLRDRNNRRQIIHRLISEKVIERTGSSARMFKTVEQGVNRIDWQNADCSDVYPVKWPFCLESLVNIYPKNIIVVAGSSNAGKSAFMYNVARLNLHRHRIRFISSEVGPEELKLRLMNFEGMTVEDWSRVDFIDRAGDFSGAIVPDALNIVDYLELSGDTAFYSVGGEIKSIFEALTSGIAVIAIQKKDSPNIDLGRGAEFTLEKCRLYLSISHGKMKIVKGKNWAQPGLNPNGKVYRYKLVGGWKFIQEREED